MLLGVDYTWGGLDEKACLLDSFQITTVLFETMARQWPGSSNVFQQETNANIYKINSESQEK